MRRLLVVGRARLRAALRARPAPSSIPRRWWSALVTAPARRPRFGRDPNQPPGDTVMFHATEIAMQLVAAIRPIAEATQLRDKDLACQMRRASNSAALNTAEGGRRVGGDRHHAFRIASGEAAESLVAARLAVAAGYAPAHVGGSETE